MIRYRYFHLIWLLPTVLFLHAGHHNTHALTAVFINEIHYDNASTDTGEAVEIAGPAGTDLTGWSIVRYNGSVPSAAVVYTSPAANPSGSDTLNGVIPNNCSGYGVVVVNYATDGLQNGTADGVALVDNNGTVIQLLSYEGTFTASNGAANGQTSTDIGVSETNSTTTGYSLQLGGSGSTYEDFTWNSAAANTFGSCNTGQTFSGGSTAPTVSSTTPGNNATNVAIDANISITFSEDVTVSSNWFSLSCTSSGSHTATVTGGPTTFTLNPDSNFANSDICTVTIDKDAVADQGATPENMANNYVFSFTTVAAGFGSCGDNSETPIHTIQGSGTVSPLNGAADVIIEGVVVGDFQASTQLNGFFVQEENSDADADPATSEGIFVYDPAGTDVAVGDVVRLQGNVTEYFELTEINQVDTLVVCSSGATLPTAASVTLPFANTTAPERFEGMSVTLPQSLTVTEHYLLARGGQLTLSSGGRLFNPTHVAAPGAAANAVQASNDLNKIVLDDGSEAQNPATIPYPPPKLTAVNTLRGGDTVSNISGVLTYSWSGWSGSVNAYRIHPTTMPTFTAVNSRPTAPTAVGGTLKVASFNVLNYFNTFSGCTNGVGGAATDCRGAENSSEFTKQRDKIIAAIAAMDADIVGLMEMENDGYGSGSAIQDLINGLAAAGANYSFINADTLTSSTNALGTDAIKVALIYKNTVSPTGTTRVMSSAVDPEFDSSKNRPALVQSFSQTATGEIITIAVNHLKSKGSDCNSVGDPDTGDGQGNCNLTRTSAAEALVTWLATDPTGVGDDDVVIMGDLNAYAMEDPITAITDAGYTNLILQFLGSSTYSFAFDGQWGYLDHALGSPSLLPQVIGVTEWHINADEPIALDYNENFKTAQQITELYASNQFRASDHDPVLIGLDLTCTSPVSPADVTIQRSGANVILSWLHDANNSDYTVLRMTSPYFDPNDAGAVELSGTISYDSGTASITDSDTVVGNPMTNYYYYVLGMNGCSIESAVGNHTAAFDFAIVPGTP
ncbi:MAG: ExeM/NucH family extracellular endonuclease [Chloroflexota bacterium]